MKPHAVLVTLAAMIGCALAYPNGAYTNSSNPMDALTPHCRAGNYRPEHGDNLAQGTESPFKIVFPRAVSIYKPNQPISIRIESTGGDTMKGFLLQADTTAPTFDGDISCGAQGKTVTFCGSKTVTHVDPSKKPWIECTWTPPDYQVGRVQFVATIVANFTTYWTGVKSEVILDPDAATMTYDQKSKQIRDNMMRSFQQKASGFLSMLGQKQGGGNQFGGGASGNQAGGFPFAGFTSGNSAAAQNLGAMFRPQGQGQAGNGASMWGGMFGQNAAGGGGQQQPNAASQFQRLFHGS